MPGSRACPSPHRSRYGATRPRTSRISTRVTFPAPNGSPMEIHSSAPAKPADCSRSRLRRTSFGNTPFPRPAGQALRIGAAQLWARARKGWGHQRICEAGTAPWQAEQATAPHREDKGWDRSRDSAVQALRALALRPAPGEWAGLMELVWAHGPAGAASADVPERRALVPRPEDKAWARSVAGAASAQAPDRRALVPRPKDKAWARSVAGAASADVPERRALVLRPEDREWASRLMAPVWARRPAGARATRSSACAATRPTIPA